MSFKDQLLLGIKNLEEEVSDNTRKIHNKHEDIDLLEYEIDLLEDEIAPVKKEIKELKKALEEYKGN